ncbi:MAG: hypothetical protein M9934_04020 [Thermomicrobiales bacterium]|nr:hypothetical protein [Thermomicrobiales bacterium]
MADEQFTGPVNYVVFGIPPTASAVEGLEIVLDQVESKAIEILDIECVRGDATACAVTEMHGEDLAAYEGAFSGLLDDDDLAEIAAELSPDWSAIVIIYEDRTMAHAARSLAKAGGTELLVGGIDIQQLEAAIG